MRKLMFFSNYIGGGGLETVMTTFANGLCEKYDVCYVYCTPSEEYKKNFNPKIRLICLNVVRFRNSLFKITKVIRQENPEIIITGSGGINIYCIIARWLSFRHPKLILSQHNYSNVELNAHQKLIFPLYNFADKVIAVSKGISNFLKGNGVKPQKVVTIYNPIDINKIKALSEEPLSIELPEQYLVFVGRLSSVKNIGLLLDAFKLVLNNYRELKLIIVGDGPEKSKLEFQSEELDISQSVILTGSLNNPFPIVKNAKALMLPSLSEALPTVVLEAFALGVTVVATPHPGAQDLLIDRHLGYVTQSFTDKQDFADCIIKALNNPDPKLKLEEEASLFAVDKKINEMIVLCEE